ncbi:VCBS domain-containing protein [Vibrio mediterranei]
MSIAALMGLVNVTGTLVLDSQGKLVVLPEGAAPRPGDVVLEQVAEQPSNELEGIKLAQVDVPSDDFGSSLLQGDQDALDIIAQIESGEDPTQNEDQATAAGDGLSSSISDAATVEAINPQVQAATFFETTGLDPRSLNDTQTNALLDIFSNAAPVTVFDLRNYDEESQDGELNLDFPIDPNGDVLTLTVTELPKLGTLTLADGTPVTLGQQLTQAEFESLQFDAPMEYTVGEDAGQFTYTVDDGRGEINSVQSGGVAININPINDIPVIVEPGEGSVTESGHFDNGDIDAGNNTATGQVVATDNDTDSVLAYSVANQSDQYGSISIDSKTGEWTYTLNNTSTATQALAEGQTATSEFTVLVTDDKGAVVTDTIVITITGTNDKPEFSVNNKNSGSVIESGHDAAGNTESGSPVAKGTLHAEDVDAGSQLKFSVQDGNSEYGKLVLQEDGQWSFTLDNTATATQALNAGDSIDLAFPVVVTDEFGAVSSDTITITITGTNDLPTVLSGSTATLNEDVDVNFFGNLVATDKLVIRDVDAGEEVFNAGEAIPVGTTWGALSIQADGTWTYTLDNSLEAVQALDVGDQRIEEFTVTSADGTSHTIAVTIHGAEDETFITGPTADTVKEDTDVDAGFLVAGDSLSLSISDKDAGENKFSTVVTKVANDDGEQPLGTLAITEDGDWSYQVSNAISGVQELGEGETRVERFTVTSIDGSKTETIEVTIQGTNDAPIIAGDDIGRVTEDFDVQAGNLLKDDGQLTISDVDAGEAKFQTSVTPVGSVIGSLTMTATGAWSYEVDNTNSAVQSLGKGETLTETFQVLSEDGTPHNIVVTIHGVNDIPTITSGDSVTAQEDVMVDGDGNIVATNTLVISDVDAGEEVFNAGIATPVGSTLGSLSINAEGEWTYKVNNSLSQIQALDVNTSLTESFIVTSADGTQHQIDVTVNGAEDPTIISSYEPGAVTEDTAGILMDSGDLSIADLDAGEALFSTTVTKLVNSDGQSPLGTLTIDANGNWHYSVDNSLTGVQELGDGITREEVFQVTSIDGSVTQNIVVIITGVDGAPAIVEGNAGSVTEDVGTNSFGNLVATDKLVIADEDAGEEVFNAGEAIPVGTTWGALSIQADGTWTYTLDNSLEAVQALDVGDQRIEEFTVTSADGTSHTIAVTIHGAEDETFITGPTTDTVKEDTDVDAGFLVAGDSLSLSISDKDAGENKFSTVVTKVANDDGEQPLGTLTITEDGDWSYQVSNAISGVQELGEGETRVERFTVTSIDGSKTETIEVTIHGTNDQPIISGTNTGDVVEDRQISNEGGTKYITEDGSLRIVDVDANESHFNTSVESIGSTLGILSINAQGDWDYKVDTKLKAIQSLAVDETIQESFRVYSADGSASEVITITITGTNDRPNIKGDKSGSVKENPENINTEVSTTGDLNPKDKDTSDTHEWSLLGSSEGMYGSFTIDPTSGTWKYILDNDKADSLSEGQIEKEVFTVQVDDGNGGTRTQNITITVEGTNDTFALSGDNSATLTEDLHTVEDGVITVSDIDIDDQFTWTVLNPNGNLGTLTVDQNGKWTYSIDKNSAEKLEQGIVYPSGTQNGEHIFQIQVTDGTATKVFDVNIDVIGTNDAPEITGTRTAELYEVNGYGQSVTQDLSTGDPDLNETESWQINNANSGIGIYGSLVLDQNGEWTYTLGVTDAQKAAVDALPHDAKVKESFSIRLTDKYAATSTKDITITVHGDNDRPIIGGDLSGSVTEDVHPNDDVTEDIKVTGSLSDGDVDTGDDHIWSLNTPKGQFGTISIDPDTGEWTYVLNNNSPTVQALRPGDPALTDTFTVTVKDDSGQIDSTATQTITISINGTNDAPELAGTTTGSVIEDTPGREVATGNLAVSDIDSTDTHSWQVQGENPVNGKATGTYGQLSVDDNGKWTYELDSDSLATRSIPPGMTVTDTFQVVVTDAGGLTNTITVTVSVAGTNSEPEIVVKPEYTVIEDGAALSGTIIAGIPTQDQLDNNVIGGGDPDQGEIVSWSVLQSGQYGTFSIDEATGTWTYVLNNNHPDVDSLDKGDILPGGDTVQIRVRDKYGVESIQEIKIVIEGENDAPNITGAQNKVIFEDAIEAGQYTTSGQLSSGDVDADDVHQWEISDSNNGRGEYGTLTMDSNGKWTFTYDQQSKLSEIRALKPGQIVTDVFEVKVTDSQGATSVETVTIQIEGQNDAPVVTGDVSATYVEDNGTDDTSDDSTPIEGQLVLTDYDNDDKAEVVISSGQSHNVYNGLSGELSIDKDGKWSFVPKNDVLQSLAEGETETEVFTILVTDRNGATVTQDITITIEGRNDVPVISGESTGTVVEDGTAAQFGIDLTRTDGQLSAVDVDNNSSIVSWSIESSGASGSAPSGVGTYGTLTLGNDGKWTYVLDNSLPATQALIAGETVQEKFYVVATDNDGGVSNRQEIVIDVIGQQDPGDGSGSGGIIPVDVSELEVTEDQQLVDRDSFIFPIPQGANFIPVNGGVYGQLVRTATGGWKYELDNDSVLVQGLDEGETATESWRIVVGPFYIDVNVTINGSADKPEITYNTDITKPQDDTVLLGEAHEDVTDSISGVLGVDDADLGDSHVWAVEDIQGEYGTLTIDPDTGKWTYVLDPSKELPAEKEVFDTFYVTVTDTEAGEGASTKSDRREVQVKVIGSAENFENPNPNDEKYIVKTITANEDNSDSNETGTGPSEIVISSDNAGGPLVLDPSIELGSQITWTLVDGNGTYGSIVVNDDGSWVFTLDNDSRAVQSLQEGETKHDVFEVYAVDQYGKTIVDDNGLPQTLEIVIDVNGQNDAPTLKANVEETIVADDVDQTISGKLAVTDIDTQDQGHHTWVATPNNVNNAYGTLVFNADGTWSYKVDPNNPDIIALGANETIEQTWTVVVTDPKGATATQTLTINIQGENQAPTMTTVDGTVTEDVIDSGGTTVSVTKAIVLDDLDTKDTVTLDPTNLDGTYGHFTVDPSTNTWKYVLFNDKPHVQSLGEGVTVTEEFTIRATDQFGAEVTQKVEVTVVGSNDQPTVSGSASGSVSDALGSTAAGKVTVSDVDVGDTHTFSVKQDSNLGTFTVDNNGNWKFVVDENNPEINALAKGQTKTIQVSVVATDSSGVTATEESNEHVINITIVGTNDAPQIVDIGEQMATENTTTQLTGNFDSGDVDTVNVADSHHWQVVSGDPRGELTVDPVTGAWTFNLTGDFEYLSEGETLSSPLSYQVKVTDEHGASDTITVNFQVTGTNDAPTIVAANTVATGTVHEDPAGAESGTANGVVTIADVDHNDTHSYSLSNSGMVTEIQGTYGTLKLIAGDTPESVKWEYVLDQDKANSLNDGPVTENFDLFIESLVGGVAQGDAIKQTIEVTVEGRNDAAIVAPESQTHAETDAPLQMSGNLNSTDVDNPDDTFTVQNNKQGTYGTFSIDANGEWTFVANQAFNSLNVGQSVEETFAVTTIDGTPTSVTVKIEGTNDAATVSVGSVERDETDAPLTITDTLTSSDVDNADNTFTPSSKVGTYGTFSIDANGVWTFVAKESFDHLNVGQSVSETFDVTSVDGTPSTVTVKINGTNDAADISAATENLTESNSILTANGTLTADDPDNANNVFVAQNGTVGNLGTFTLTAAGVWTFTAKSNFDNLAEGQKAEESFTVTSIDGTTSEVKIVITGTNDAATVSSADVTLQETNAVLSTSGTLTSLDIDNPDNKF